MSASLANDFNPPDSIASDMLTGADEISAYTGDTLRRTNYLLEKKLLPAFQEGRIWKMRKSTYRTYVERLESAALQHCIAAK